MAGGSMQATAKVVSVDSRLSGPRLTQSLVVVTSLFFMWAIALNLNDVLIPHLKKACDLTDTQSSLIQTAYFGAYFLMALPAGALMRRVGYGAGIVLGLLLCAAGAFLFYPAAETRTYSLFLAALFIMASGACTLEVAANPYVSVLGPPSKAELRLNTAQFFNAVGAILTPQIGKLFILSGIEKTPAELSAMPPQALEAYRAFEAAQVQGPYLVLGGAFVVLAGIVLASRLPEIKEALDPAEAAVSAQVVRQEGRQTLFGLLRHRRLAFGVVAQFFYVGAQVGIASFMIRFARHAVGAGEKAGAEYLFYHLLAFGAGRMVGTFIMSRMAPARLLTIFGLCAMACTLGAVTSSGLVALTCLVLVGFFNSIMFPTIFALAIKGLGADTKMASSLIVMSIVGGALVPLAMGAISDAASISLAFLVPAFCYVVVTLFGLYTARPGQAA